MRPNILEQTDASNKMAHVGLPPLQFEVWVETHKGRWAMEGNMGCGIDYYQVLGLDDTASMEEIRRAYKQQALRWHPDKVAPESREAATERFKAVNGAYSVLTDEKRRTEYDRARATSASTGSPMPGRPVSLAEAWEIFIKVILSVIARQYELSDHGSERVVHLISTLGIAAVLAVAWRGSGGVAVSALTAALLNLNGAITVYRELSDEEKAAFGQAIMLLARSMEY